MHYITYLCSKSDILMARIALINKRFELSNEHQLYMTLELVGYYDGIHLSFQCNMAWSGEFA